MAETNVNNQNQEQNNNQNQGNTGVYFTQADVDRIVGERLARAKNSGIDDADVAEFKKWKSSQKTQAQKDAEKEAELSAAKAEIAQMKAEKNLLAAEAKPEFVEFVTAQVMAMSGDDVDANIKDYKKTHPQYFGTPVVVKKSTSQKLTGSNDGAATTNDIMNGLLRNRGQAES